MKSTRSTRLIVLPIAAEVVAVQRLSALSQAAKYGRNLFRDYFPPAMTRSEFEVANVVCRWDGLCFRSLGARVSPVTYPLLPCQSSHLATRIWPSGDPGCFCWTTTPATPLGPYFALLSVIPCARGRTTWHFL